MRLTLRVLALLLVGIGALAALPRPAAAFDLFNLKDSLITIALEQISTDDFTIEAEGVESPGDGITELVGVTIADRQGVWFRAGSMSLQWNASAILGGELEINRLAADRVEVLRAPSGEVEVAEDEAPEEEDGSPFEWPRSPITTRVEELSLTDVFIAEGVFAPASIRFDATGAAEDAGDIQAARLAMKRTDEIAGSIDFAYARNFADNTLTLDIGAEEAAGGLVVSIAGLPNDSASRLSLKGAGPLTNWGLTFASSSDRVFEAEGEARVDIEGPLSVQAAFALRPGEAMDPATAAVIGREARLDVDVAETPEGVVEIAEANIASPALNLTTSGRYEPESGAVALDIDLSAESQLADVAEGVTFGGFGFEGDVTGQLDALVAAGRLSLDDLRTETADIGAAALQTQVEVQGPEVRFDVGGDARQVRIDKIGPELLGTAEIAARGLYDGEALRLETFTLRSAPLDIEARGTVGLASADAALDYRLSTPSLAPLAAPYGVDANGQVNVSGIVSGPFDQVRLRGEAALEALRFEGQSYGEVRLSHDVTLGDRIGGTLDLAADGSPFGRVDADLAFALVEQRLDLSRLEATALGARVDGAVAYALDTGLLDGDVTLEAPNLAPLERVTGTPARGAVSGRVGFRPVGREQRMELDLTGEDIDAAGAIIRRLVVDGAVDDALDDPAIDLRLDGEGLAFEEARLGGIEGRIDSEDITGKGDMSLGLTIADFAGFGAAAGRVEIAGTLTGADLLDEFPILEGADLRLAADRLAYDDARLAEVRGTLNGTHLTRVADLELDVTARAASGFGALAERVRLRGTLADAELMGETPALGELDVTLEGDGLAYQDTRLRALRAKVSGTDLLSESPTADLDAMVSGVAGAAEVPEADLTATIRPERDGARLRARLAAPKVGAGGATVSGTRLEATVSDLLRAANVDATLLVDGIDAEGTEVGAIEVRAAVRRTTTPDPRLDVRWMTGPVRTDGARLATVMGDAKGALSALDVTLETAGSVGQLGTTAEKPVDLRLGARVDAVRPEPRAVVSTLDAGFAGERLSLRAPITVTAGDVTRVENIDIALPGGGLVGAATLYPNGMAANLDLDLADLALVNRLADAPVRGGALEAEVVLDSRPARANGRVRLATRGIRFADVVAEAGALDITMDGDWNGRVADVRAEIAGPFGDPIRATVALPVRPTGGVAPELQQGGPLSGRIDWEGDVGKLWVLVPAPGHVLDGALRIDLGVDGTLEAPRVFGDIALAEGRYENLDVGTILTDLTLASRVDSAGEVVLDLRAEDGAGSPLTADVRVDLAENLLEAALRSSGAVLVRRDDAKAAVSLDIAAAGPLAGPDISGTVTIDRAEIRLVNATPPSVQTLGDVRIKGVPPPPDEEPAGQDIALDVKVRAPRDIFVRGRGLNSEWSIDLDVSGTAAAPRVTGGIERVRGELLLVGTVFDLETGEVRFTGGQKINPDLDVELVASENGITGGIRVSGRADDIEIGFFSVPSLPEDEVLPRLLFGKSSQSLTAGQAIRLASGLAVLLDGTGGPVDAIRGAAGLDVLSIEPTDAGADVTLGKNVADNVFVGAKQSVDGQETRLSVEVEVFEDILLDSEVDREGDASVGVNWRKDF